MILKRVLSAAAAAGAVLAGAGVVVVAAAYALYAWMKMYMPPAAASAVVAAVVAVIILVVALIALRGAKGKSHKPHHHEHKDEPRSLVDRGLELARERPLIAAGGALAAGLIALRNPALIAVLTSLVNPPQPGSRR